jgi:predicted transcriptional regulator of viral defense system
MPQNLTQTEHILRSAERRGVLRPRDLDRLGISRTALSRLHAAGKLVRLGRGLYALPETPGRTEHQALMEVASRVPQSVICLLSALRFHGLTTQAPFEIWIAVDRRAWRPRIDYPPIRVLRFSGRALTEGIETHTIGGVKVHVYSPAKTVADCFKYRNKFGLDVALEALRDVWRAKRATIDELLRCARICRVEGVMRPYLESLA